MKTYRLNQMLLLLFCTLGVTAQSTKLEKTYKTNANSDVFIEAKHTNIIVEYWDKDEVQIEAYLETETKDKARIKELLNNWKLKTRTDGGNVWITSGGNAVWNSNMDFASLEGPLSQLPGLMEPLMNDLVGPLLQNIASNPLPPEFYENLGDLNFDYEAYKKDGDKYLEKFEKKIDKKFGKDFERSMEKWAANFEKDSVMWKKNFEMKMEAWGEDFGKSMEAWGEQFGANMEQWASELEKEIEAEYGDENSKVIVVKSKTIDANAKKSIKVKLPKTARLHLDARHGDVKLSGVTSNLKANLSHSKLTASTIDGKKTNVTISYTPVKIKNWKYGVLNMSYVKDCVIEEANSIKLTANSSDVVIKELGEIGILAGNFGELTIGELSSNFKNLDIRLENSDLKLSIPRTAFNFNYNGTQSDIKYPGSMTLKSTKSYDNEILKGFYKAKGAEGNITIHASFSDVLVN